MFKTPLENIAYKFVFISPTVHVLLILLERFVRWEESRSTAAVLQVAASRICLKQHTTSLCDTNLAFSPSISLESKWCNHTVVLTLLELRRIPVLFCQRPEFHMVDNLSIAVHALPISMLKSLSIDVILLPRYMNWSTNFKGLPFDYNWRVIWFMIHYYFKKM